MSPRPVDVVRECLEAARRGELDTVRSLLHARVRWHEFDQPESGCQDREQAIGFVERVLDEGGVLKLEALGEPGDQVVANLRPRRRRRPALRRGTRARRPDDYTIYDAPHGFRELGVQDPDGHDVGFGQPIARGE